MPWLSSSLGFYERHALVDPGYVEALGRLRELVPRRAPVFTSHQPRLIAETLGPDPRSWPHPTIEYYANRPLLFSRDPREVEANAPRCAAYLLGRTGKSWSTELERALARSFESVPVGQHHVIYLLGRPLRRESAGGARPAPNTDDR